nr:MAG TPA: hypothetical protein [Caudoviricetes sp.]
MIPAISRIARPLNRQDRGRQQTYECTCKQPKVNCITTHSQE